jgi:hypothetical protein
MKLNAAAIATSGAIAATVLTLGSGGGARKCTDVPVSFPDAPEPIYVIDGERFRPDSVPHLDRAVIHRISVVCADYLYETFGIKARRTGVVIFTVPGPEKVLRASMDSIAVLQGVFFEARGRFASDVAELGWSDPSGLMTVDMMILPNDRGWTATGSHRYLGKRHAGETIGGSSNHLQQQSEGYSDAHVHLNDPAAWVRIMDERGIARSVALSGRNVNNADLLEAGRRWPGRILPFVSVSPEHREFRPAWEADDESLAPVVDALLSQGGYYGIGEISVSHYPASGFPEADYDPNGRSMRSLFEVARKHRVPILIHAEVTRLREFEQVVRDHRDVTVIWAHGGYTPLFLANRLMHAHPNLIYELSARTWARHPRSPDYTIFRNDTDVWPEWLEFIESMPTRFLVGTDAAGRSEASDVANARRVQLFLDQLSADTRRRVATANLERILGLTAVP